MARHGRLDEMHPDCEVCDIELAALVRVGQVPDLPQSLERELALDEDVAGLVTVEQPIDRPRPGKDASVPGALLCADERVDAVAGRLDRERRVRSRGRRREGSRWRRRDQMPGDGVPGEGRERASCKSKPKMRSASASVPSVMTADRVARARAEGERAARVRGATECQLTLPDPFLLDLICRLGLGPPDEPARDSESLGREEARVLRVRQLPHLTEQRRREARMSEEGGRFLAGCSMRVLSAQLD